MADNITIRVSTEELMEASQQVQSSLNDMNSRFSSIAQAVNRSNGYWQGEAAENHRRVYQEMSKTVEEIMARLGEHVTDLQNMGQVYADSETEVTEMSSALPSDVII